MNKKQALAKARARKKAKKEQALNENQKRFVQEYLIDLNATQAYIRAGYKSKQKAAEANAARLLSDDRVAAAIQLAMTKRAEKLEITSERVLAEIAKMAFANMQDYTRIDGGSLRADMSKVSRDQLAAVQEFTVDIRREYDGEQEESGVVEKFRFKLADKKGNLELLGRHLKLFTDKVEVDLTDRAALLIAARKRRETAA